MAIWNQGKHYDSEADFMSIEWTHYGRKGEDKRNVFSTEYSRTSDWYFTSGKSLCPTKKIKTKEFENTKGVIRIRISKKNKQHNGQNKKYKLTNNDQQNIHIKLKID
jgi:hypothetical protein